MTSLTPSEDRERLLEAEEEWLRASVTNVSSHFGERDRDRDRDLVAVRISGGSIGVAGVSVILGAWVGFMMATI